MQVLGIQRLTKKDGSEATILHVKRDFDEYELKTGEGFACENIYVGHSLPYLQLGDVIEIVYGKGFQGKAVIKDISVIPGETDFE